jgi:transposase
MIVLPTVTLLEGFSESTKKKLQRQYKNHLSSFNTWTSREHAHQWIIYPKNIDTHLSIDEVALSQGELYTIVPNKKAKGKKGSLVAIVAGTKADQVIEHNCKIDYQKKDNLSRK